MNPQEYTQKYIGDIDPLSVVRERSADPRSLEQIFSMLSGRFYSDQAYTSLEYIGHQDIINILEDFSQEIGLVDKLGKLTPKDLIDGAKINNAKFEELVRRADKLTEELSERDLQLADDKQQLLDRDKKTIELNHQLTDQDRRLVEFVRQLSERDREIIQLQGLLSQFEQRSELVDQQERISDLHQKLTDLARQSAAREKQLLELGKVLSNLKRDQAQRIEQQLIESNKKLAEQAAIVAILGNKNSELESELDRVKDIRGQLAQKTTDISNLQADLSTARTNLGHVEEKVTDIYSSHSWRITMPLRCVAILIRRMLGIPTIEFGSEGGCCWRGISIGKSSNNIPSKYYVWRALKIEKLQRLLQTTRLIVQWYGGGIRGVVGLVQKTGSTLRNYGLGGFLYRVKWHMGQVQSLEGFEALAARLELATPLRDGEVIAHTGRVDVIVCVHNALDDVRRCLNSVLEHSSQPYSLIIVDDGSSEQTKKYLENFSERHGVTLIRNDSARGYTRAANQGLRKSTGEYVVLLNSDTIVINRWMSRLVMCLESDPKVGLVGPLSNTASWQSVPEIEERGDWAENKIPAGQNVDSMAQLIAETSGRVYPIVPFLNGFCLMLKRRLIEEIGLFDEINFPQGYGEENDYCLRARSAGWKLAVADDTYIYHAQSKSYSHDRRKQLSAKAGVTLAGIHGHGIIDDGVRFCREDRVMNGLRARARLMLQRKNLVDKACRAWKGTRVVVLLPITVAGGGGNVVIAELLAMRKMGVDVQIINLARNQWSFERSHPGLEIPVLYAKSDKDIPLLCKEFDAVIATFNTTVSYFSSIEHGESSPVLGYYVQDYEPYFYPNGTREYQSAKKSYSLIPEMVCITKTEWNRDEVLKQTGIECHVTGPSVDVDIFRPRVRSSAAWPNRPLRIGAMIRPSSPRRNGQGHLDVLREISKQHRENIEIIIFGVDPHDPEFQSLLRDFPFINIGLQTSKQLALVFNELDIFVDFSTYQAMGLTAMEAMACGTAVIVPSKGGASSFANHEQNALVVETTSYSDCVASLQRLIVDAELRSRLQQTALQDMVKYYPESSAYAILAALFKKKSRKLQ